jgi:hypothetical protein
VTNFTILVESDPDHALFGQGVATMQSVSYTERSVLLAERV